MAELSAAADPGSGHLLGHVPGDGQAVSVAAHHVGSPRVNSQVFAFHVQLCFHWPPTNRAALRLPGTNRVTALTSTSTALHLQIALMLTLPLFLPPVPFTSTCY